MALTEKTVIDKIEIVGEYKHIQIRKKNQVLKDGVEVASNFHRYVLSPSDDISGQPKEVKDICNIAWSQSVRDSWAAKLELDKTSTEV